MEDSLGYIVRTYQERKEREGRKERTDRVRRRGRGVAGRET